MSERRYAVLIGNSKFPDEPRLAPLRCPEHDVDGLNTILKTYGDFAEPTVLKNVRHYEALEKIYEALARAQKDGFAVIYYSGHGKRDQSGRLHLATYNTIIDKLVATSIPVETLRSYIDDTGCQKVVLMLDCCYSGAAGTSFKSSTEDELQRLVTEGRGTYLMTASTGIQLAVEKEGDQYGVFTKHIIDGIQSGEADLDRDGYVRVDELYDYVHKHMLQEGQQRPTKWALDVRGDLIIARNPRPVQPAELPQETQEAIASPRRGVRLDAIDELNHLLRGKHKGLALAAEAALLQLCDNDDSLKVRQAARKCLEAYAQDATKPSAERPTDVRTVEPEVPARVTALSPVGEERTVSPSAREKAGTEGTENTEGHPDRTVDVAPLDAPQAKPPVLADPAVGTAALETRLAEETVQDAVVSTEPVLENSPADLASNPRVLVSGGRSASLAGTDNTGRAPTVQMVEPVVNQVIGPPLGEPATVPPAIQTQNKLEKGAEGEHISVWLRFPHILRGMAALLGIVAIGVLVIQIMRHYHPPEQIVRPSHTPTPRPIPFTTIDVPGATRTVANGINGAGQMVGWFDEPKKSGDYFGEGQSHGFLRDAAGAFTTIDDRKNPNPSGELINAHANGINSAGLIVGTSNGYIFIPSQGFLRTAAGAFTIIKVPGAAETDAEGINGAGEIVGFFTDKKTHGYLRSAAGAFTTIDIPGATETRVRGINGAGEIVGSFTDAGKKIHGFLRSAAGAFTTIDIPGAAWTEANGINSSGQIVGNFQDAEGKWHGYLRSASGAFTTIDIPGATETHVRGINDAGQIVGTFHDKDAGNSHGFLTQR